LVPVFFENSLPKCFFFTKKFLGNFPWFFFLDKFSRIFFRNSEKNYRDKKSWKIVEKIFCKKNTLAKNVSKKPEPIELPVFELLVNKIKPNKIQLPRKFTKGKAKW
jgi:hypothetical protein